MRTSYFIRFASANIQHKKAFVKPPSGHTFRFIYGNSRYRVASSVFPALKQFVRYHETLCSEPWNRLFREHETKCSMTMNKALSGTSAAIYNPYCKDTIFHIQDKKNAVIRKVIPPPPSALGIDEHRGTVFPVSASRICKAPNHLNISLLSAIGWQMQDDFQTEIGCNAFRLLIFAGSPCGRPLLIFAGSPCRSPPPPCGRGVIVPVAS